MNFKKNFEELSPRKETIPSPKKKKLCKDLTKFINSKNENTHFPINTISFSPSIFYPEEENKDYSSIKKEFSFQLKLLENRTNQIEHLLQERRKILFNKDKQIYEMHRMLQRISYKYRSSIFNEDFKIEIQQNLLNNKLIINGEVGSKFLLDKEILSTNNLSKCQTLKNTQEILTLNIGLELFKIVNIFLIQLIAEERYLSLIQEFNLKILFKSRLQLYKEEEKRKFNNIIRNREENFLKINNSLFIAIDSLKREFKVCLKFINS